MWRMVAAPGVARDSITPAAHGWRSIVARAARIVRRSVGCQSASDPAPVSVSASAVAGAISATTDSARPSRRSSLSPTW